MTDTVYGLVLSFARLFKTDDEERAFVLGVEFGGISQRMDDGREATIEVTTHVENREIIDRAAAAHGWEVERNGSGVAGWDFTVLTKVRGATPNPHGLRVVDQT